MTRKFSVYSHFSSSGIFNEPATSRGVGAAPTRRAARILAGCFVARQSKTAAGILLPRAAHPAKIRSSAAIRASDLVHWVSRDETFGRFVPSGTITRNPTKNL